MNFLPAFAMLGFWRDDFWVQLMDFLLLTFRGLGLGLLISIPIGIILSRFPRWSAPVISFLALVQTIPSLAFIGFCISLLAMADGANIAITCAVVYSVFPIVLNTFTGIDQVDKRLKDSARGMGMTDLQVLWKVELPLAMPVIMAGVRTGAVYAIGMITICAIAGASGLGVYVTTGLSRGDVALTLFGIISILLLTAVIIFALNRLSDFAKNHGTRGLVLCVGLILLLSLYAVAEPVIHSLVLPAAQAQELKTELKQRTLVETWQASKDFWRQFGLFLSLMLRGLGLALLIGLPMGMILSRFERVASPFISALALVQTVPSLALLGLCASLFGLFGSSATIFATVIYSLLPIVLNTYTGITSVNPNTRDAARGMGMTDMQVLWKVEVPLALPVIMAGVRTAATYSIIMVTIGVLVGARGLGGYIMEGITQKDNPLILLGVIPILLLSLAVFFSLSAISWLSRVRASMGQMVSAVLILCMSTFALAEPFVRPKADIRVGAKNFAENLLLGQIIKILIETHTDLTVDLFPNLGSNFAYKSLLADNIDVYPEYTGTLLTASDAMNLTVPKDSNMTILQVVKEEIKKRNITIPKGADPITVLVRQEMKEGFGVVLLETFGLNNTYSTVARKSFAEKHNLQTIGDLSKLPGTTVIAGNEFNERPDGWPGLARLYGLEKLKCVPLDPSLMYNKLEAGQANVVIGFATDWQLFVYKDELAELEDNKRYFPTYHAAPLIRSHTLEKYPQLAEVLYKLKGRIDDGVIRKLNYQVVVKKRRAAEVAREFLEKEALVEIGAKK